MARINYVSNPTLRDEIAKSNIAGQMTDNLARGVMLIASRYSSKGNWRGYSFRDELEAAGIVAMVAGWNKFDATKSDNPFAYLTAICHNAFLNVLRREKKVQHLRDDLLFAAGRPTSFAYEDRFAPAAPKLPKRKGRPTAKAAAGRESVETI